MKAASRLQLLRLPGIVVGLCYAVASAAVLVLLLQDAWKVDADLAAVLWSLVAQYSVNSASVAIPAAISCTVIGGLLAFKIRFVAQTSSFVPLAFLLAPFILSPIAFYEGVQLMLGGPGTLSLLAGLILRYLPVCTAILLVAMLTVPVGVRATATNLGLPEKRVMLEVVGRAIAPTAVLVSVFLCLLMPLDLYAGMVAGGGQLQTFANLIYDYNRTSDVQEASSLMAASFLLLAITALSIFIGRGAEQVRIHFNRRSGIPLGTLGRRGIIFSPVYLAYVLFVIAIVVLLLSQPPIGAVAFQELAQGLLSSSLIIVPAAFGGAAVALLVAAQLHFSRTRTSRWRLRLFSAAVIIPPLIPGVLAGRMAAVVQGVLGQHGGGLALGLWYLYFFGPLIILLVLTHPVLLDRALPAIAENHRVSRRSYIFSIMLPSLAGTLVVGAAIFMAVALSDSLLVRYIGGATKTLGLVLANHQETSLLSGDYKFLGGLTALTLMLLLATGAVLRGAQRSRRLRR